MRMRDPMAAHNPNDSDISIHKELGVLFKLIYLEEEHQITHKSHPSCSRILGRPYISGWTYKSHHKKLFVNMVCDQRHANFSLPSELCRTL
jgi:hypothetical protein